MTTKKNPEDLRSYGWFGPDTIRGFSHRSRMLLLGYQREDFIGKPVIADGRDQRKPSGDFPARGPDVARQLERKTARQRHRCLEVLDRALRGQRQ